MTAIYGCLNMALMHSIAMALMHSIAMALMHSIAMAILAGQGALIYYNSAYAFCEGGGGGGGEGRGGGECCDKKIKISSLGSIEVKLVGGAQLQGLLHQHLPKTLGQSGDETAMSSAAGFPLSHPAIRMSAGLVWLRSLVKSWPFS